MTTNGDPGNEQIRAAHDDVEMMKRPDLWSWRPFLPLVHATERDADKCKRVAILKYSDATRRWIFMADVNLFSGKKEMEGPFRAGGEDLLYEIFNEGWRVD